MVNPTVSPEAAPILQLLTDYSFDTDHDQAEVVVEGWLRQFEAHWVSQAITEALYQGRYKMVSVEHILQLWQRRGQPLRHFNREFESIVLGPTLLGSCNYGVGKNSTGSLLSFPEPAPDRAGGAESSPTVTSAANSEETSTPSATTPLEATDGVAGDTAPPHPAEGTGQDGIPNFRPLTPEPSSPLSSADTIPPFVPEPVTSELHQRLKAVVEAELSDR